MIALFTAAALMAIAVTSVTLGTVFAGRSIERFISIFMVLLGLQKLQDVERFATMFLNYDLLAQRWVRYGYVYPFVETGAGLLMMAGVLTWLSAPAALVVSGIGAVSVFKAVYIDKREIKCACVGGDSKVPLGFVSLTENLHLIGMALWVLSKL
ncbi:MauE/DoxX family redox-associated membrane protein [Aliiroseovarius sp. YM-037]|uniref:MauE/DoxX family redox-associated membrane protein n=1 Tax=Aliiroseovarius sp. YM-037 TaxID=3341728 RepID=UPI003A8019FD